MLHNLVVVLSKDEILLIVSKLIGGHTVEGDTEFVCNQPAEVGNQTEDTDTSCDGGGLCEDIVGG